MKNKNIFFLILLFSFSIQSKDNKKQQQETVVQDVKKEEPNIAPLIVTNFGAMIGNVLNIISDPNDQQAVCSNISSITQAMCNIVALGLRSEKSVESILKDYSTSADGILQINSIAKRSLKLKFDF